MRPSTVQLSSRDSGIDDIAPAFGLGQLGQVEHQASLDQFLGLTAMVELRGGHRVAAGECG
jgi:hypothetical protein